VETRPRRNPGIPDVLWRLIASCVDKNPARRPRAGELGDALRIAAVRLGAAPALPRPPRLPVQGTFTARPWIPTQRRRIPAWHAITTVVSGFLLLAVALVAFEWPGRGVSTDAGASPASAPASPSGSPKAKGAKRADAAAPAESTGAALTVNRMAPSAPTKPRAADPREAKARPPTSYGQPRCTGYQWKFLQPAFANTCYTIGPGLRISGALKSKDVAADITLTLTDPAGSQVGGAYTCRRLAFGPQLSERICGAFELHPPRGRRYVLVQSWLIYGPDGTGIRGSAKTAEFAF
jgi:hypothetical protein